MRKEYDFSKAVKNPYKQLIQKAISIRIESETLNYFKELSSEMGVPYQQLISFYLNECKTRKRKLRY